MTEVGSHPRKYRLTRRTPGLSWTPWTHSYHRTLGQARESAAQFFGGCGQFGMINQELVAQRSEVEVFVRHDNGSFVRYESVTKWTVDHIGGTS